MKHLQQAQKRHPKSTLSSIEHEFPEPPECIAFVLFVLFVFVNRNQISNTNYPILSNLFYSCHSLYSCS